MGGPSEIMRNDNEENLVRQRTSKHFPRRRQGGGKKKKLEEGARRGEKKAGGGRD